MKNDLQLSTPLYNFNRKRSTLKDSLSFFQLKRSEKEKKGNVPHLPKRILSRTSFEVLLGLRNRRVSTHNEVIILNINKNQQVCALVPQEPII